MITKKINIERIRIQVEFAITKKEKHKRDRRGTYHLKLDIPTLNPDNQIEYLKAEVLFLPNKSALFIENAFKGEDLDLYLSEYDRISPTAIQPKQILEIENLVQLAFENRIHWQKGKTSNYVYHPAKCGMLSIRLVSETG